MIEFAKSHAIVFFFGILTLLILWQMLLPGFILTLDMVWVPSMPLVWSEESINNTFLVSALIHYLSLYIPSWIIQKVLLAGLFFLLLYLPWRFLPYIEKPQSRLFAAMLYTFNPFVYSRMLAGQWMVLYGYALLPFFLCMLLRVTQNPTWRNTWLYALALFLISLFSIHSLYIVLLISGIWFAVSLLLSMKQAQYTRFISLLQHSVLSMLILAGVSFYWLIPALLREAPLEERFNQAHTSAFAATGNEHIPVWLNTLALGGFWGEAHAWKYYFAWPQETLIFWIAFAFLFFLVLLGLFFALTEKDAKRKTLMLLAIALCAYITGQGTADTIFQSLNEWLYAHVPLWSGLRDSHKVIGVFALVFVTFAGLGFDAFIHTLKRLDQKNMANIAIPLLFVLPAVFGLYMWGGFQKQLQPVWYPPAWDKAKQIVETVPEEEKIVVLPWQGYLSLDFNNQLLVANPASMYFDPSKTVVSRSAAISGVYDQEVDARYRAIDQLFKNHTEASLLYSALKEQDITHILFIQNKAAPDSKSIEHIKETVSIDDPLYQTMIDAIYMHDLQTEETQSETLLHEDIIIKKLKNF